MCPLDLTQWCFVSGPYGEKDDQQVFVQKIVPDTDSIFVRCASTGKRFVCDFNSGQTQITLHPIPPAQCRKVSAVSDRNKVYSFRVCVIKSVDDTAITAFCVHECEGSSRMGSRPRRYIFTGHADGSIQVRDTT